MTEARTSGRPSSALRRVLVPLALAQFICSFAGSNMNVMINDISKDLDTTVQGVQIAITIFLLVMAALMIPGGKLTDRYGRKRCFIAGLVLYGIGALLSAVSPGLGVLILGNSIFEGVGTALLIPPVYILTTLLFTELTTRARAFGAISALGGIGAAAGPADRRPDHLGHQLAGSVRVPGPGHRRDPLAEPADRGPAAGGSEPHLRHARRGPVRSRPRARRHGDPGCRQQHLADAGPDPRRRARPRRLLPEVRAKERAGDEPLLPTALFRKRTSNLGLVTQNVQWLMLLGVSFIGRGIPPGRARVRRHPDRRDLHARRRSACSSPRSAPSASRSDAPSGRSSWRDSSSPSRESPC